MQDRIDQDATALIQSLKLVKKEERWTHVDKVIIDQLSKMKLDTEQDVFSLWNLLWRAINNEEWHIVNKMLDTFPNLNLNFTLDDEYYKNQTLFWRLACYKQWEIVDRILEKHSNLNLNASPNNGVNKGITILLLIVAHQQWNIVNKILDTYSNLDFNASAENDQTKGITALWLLARNKQWGIFNKILDTYSNLDFNASAENGDNKGITTLWLIAEDQQWGIFNRILDSYSNLDFNASAENGDNKGITTLWLIAEDQQWGIFNRILDSYSNLDFNASAENGDDKGITILQLVVLSKWWNIVKKILLRAQLTDKNLAAFLPYKPSSEQKNYLTQPWKLILVQANKEDALIIFSQVFIQYILLYYQSYAFPEKKYLTSATESSNLWLKLEALVLEFNSALSNQYHSIINSAFKNIKLLYEKIALSVLNLSSTSLFNFLPKEILDLLAVITVQLYFPAASDQTNKPLIDLIELFRKIHAADACLLIAKRTTLYIFSQWKKAHLGFLLDKHTLVEELFSSFKNIVFDVIYSWFANNEQGIHFSRYIEKTYPHFYFYPSAVMTRNLIEDMVSCINAMEIKNFNQATIKATLDEMLADKVTQEKSAGVIAEEITTPKQHLKRAGSIALEDSRLKKAEKIQPAVKKQRIDPPLVLIINPKRGTSIWKKIPETTSASDLPTTKNKMH